MLYLDRLRLLPERVPDDAGYPFDLPALQDLDLRFDAPVTFLLGENGCGKTTLIEALAVLLRLPPGGGGRNELADLDTPPRSALLADALRPSFRQRPRDAYFFRADFHAHFASVLDRRDQDPSFGGHDPYAQYGQRSLHRRSHGESFLALFQNRLREGLYLLDEPESALSPQRQLTLLAELYQRVRGGMVQLVVATHSPLLLTFPGARILRMDGGRIAPVALEDTDHYRITRDLLSNPEIYWDKLRAAFA